MRIHTNTLTMRDLYDAARIARVTFADDTPTEHGSRKRDHAFNVLLRGESRRAPNQGTRHWSEREYGQHAATWDQWGVFLAVLFQREETMLTPYDKDAEAFADRTADRFGAPEDVILDGENGYSRHFAAYGWPEDAHGDHTFRFAGVPRQQSCTKCTAVQHW